MHASGPFNRKDPRGEASRVSAAAQTWQLELPAVLLWAMTAATRVPRGSGASWRLEYDASMRLVSFEVWSDGARVYGVDDLL